jgi:hypothetical protein
MNGMRRLTVLLYCQFITVQTNLTYFTVTNINIFREGLGCLKKGDGDQARIQANKLFRQSIKKDPKHLPSYLSLIALQLFHEEDHKSAMETIRDAKTKFPKNEDLKNLELDAKAMSVNLGHMVLAGSFASPHLEGALVPAKTSTPPYSY